FCGPYESILLMCTASPAPSILCLHDALPIWGPVGPADVGNILGMGSAPDLGTHSPLPLSGVHGIACRARGHAARGSRQRGAGGEIGRAQRLNSSHQVISYAVFCLKKTTVSGT